jgi:hypothetical protein
MGRVLTKPIRAADLRELLNGFTPGSKSRVG